VPRVALVLHLEFDYHQGKANIVVDPLSRYSMGILSHIYEEKIGVVMDIHSLVNFEGYLF